jgi:Phosphate-starvation-inducible E.
MVVVIALAGWSFLRLTYFVAAAPLADIGYGTFQVLFDRLLATVIALELARSVMLLVEGRHGLVQVRIILVIGLLAVVRKLIVIEVETVEPVLLFGLAGAILALSVALGMLLYLDLSPRRTEIE